MYRNANSEGAGARNAKLIGLALTTALATATLSGCASSSTPPAALSASKAESELAKGKYESASSHAEAAVLAEPRNAAYRATLGAAYLDAGRFASAATSFQDAIALGDTSAQTALSLALALSADGKMPEALAVLNERKDDIAPSDLGLAYALAGQPERGAMVLANAIRNGENTVKTRQNLAYSYALGGKWREARLMAAQDVPAGKLGDRMAEWAQQANPAAYRERIAGLLSVPASAKDPGQPTALALSNYPDAQQLAEQTAAPQPMADLAAAPQTNAPADAELPPIGDPVDSSVLAKIDPAPSVAASRSDFGTAFRSTPAPAPVAMNSASFTPKPKAAAGRARADRSAPTAQSTHLVQLGSFSSEAGARRAWSIYAKRYPELASHDMVITKAVVNGKNYWRVSAAGYDARSSQAMCGRVTSGGNKCFAYAEGRPLPGAVETDRQLALR